MMSELLFLGELSVKSLVGFDKLKLSLSGVKRSYTFGPSGGGYEDPMQ